MLKDQYECPHFRILIIGRANAGKTTILEKVCGVAQGTKPVVYDERGYKINASKPLFKLFAPIKQLLGRKPVPQPTHLIPSMEVSCM
jgi:ABC-type branched-subunit amino acid transport system ATPase component